MLVLIDESILSKDYYMETPALTTLRKYGTIILCQAVLDKVFEMYLKEHDAEQLTRYKDFIDEFLIENGNVYPESYPRLTEDEKRSELAKSTS